MKYLVHVIDEASKFRLNHESGEYELSQSMSESQSPCEIQRSDCFYSISASDTIEAVTIVSQKIKIVDENERPISLAFKVIENHKKIKSSEIGLGDSSILDPSPLSVANVTHSTLTTTMCQVERNGEDGCWIENHKIYIYICPVDRIVDLDS